MRALTPPDLRGSPSRRQIFISNNLADDEVTTLERIQLFGQSIAPTDMSEFKKVG